ncbi:MAG: hypothetical protein ACT4QB_10490 [Gammaproteobacteria bacterium]
MAIERISVEALWADKSGALIEQSVSGVSGRVTAWQGGEVAVRYDRRLVSGGQVTYQSTGIWSIIRAG